MVNCSGIWMVKRCEDLGFALKAAEAVGVPREFVGQDFDRHIALQLGVPRPIDLSHSAFTQKGYYFERTQSCTNIYRHCEYQWRRITNLRSIMPRSDKGSKLRQNS